MSVLTRPERADDLMEIPPFDLFRQTGMCHYTQRDPRWARRSIGPPGPPDPPTFTEGGCFLTAVASIASLIPLNRVTTMFGNTPKPGAGMSAVWRTEYYPRATPLDGCDGWVCMGETTAEITPYYIHDLLYGGWPAYFWTGGAWVHVPDVVPSTPGGGYLRKPAWLGHRTTMPDPARLEYLVQPQVVGDEVVTPSGLTMATPWHAQLKPHGITDRIAREIALHMWFYGIPVIAAFRVSRGLHAVVITGWDGRNLLGRDPDFGATGTFAETGMPSVLPMLGTAPTAEARYAAWCASVTAAFTFTAARCDPRKFTTRNWLVIDDDPAGFDLLVVDPAGRRSGIAQNGTPFADAHPLGQRPLIMTVGAEEDPIAALTEPAPAGPPAPEPTYALLPPADGVHRLTASVRSPGRLTLSIGQHTGGTEQVLTAVDRAAQPGDVLRFEIATTGGQSTASEVAGFPPPAARPGPDRTAVTGQRLIFDAGASSGWDGRFIAHHWDFGDGADDDGPLVTHAFTDAGTYPVALTVTDVDDRTATATCQVTVEPAPVVQPEVPHRPVAMISGGPFVAVVDGDVIFLAHDSYDVDDISGDSLTPRWDFGDGQVLTSDEGIYTAVRHRYSTPGTYPVTLVVSDGTLESLPATTRVEVVPQPDGWWVIGGRLDGLPAAVDPGSHVPVTFTDISWADYIDLAQTELEPMSDEEAQAWANQILSAGDTGFPPTFTLVEQVPLGPFAHRVELDWHVPETWTPGTYDFNLYFQESLPSSWRITVPANHLPTAVIAERQLTGAAGQPVTLDGSPSFDPDGDPLTYSWDFGDGATGTGAAPAHVYDAPGDYVAVLEVHDGSGPSARTPECVARISVTGTTLLIVSTIPAALGDGSTQPFRYRVTDPAGSTVTEAGITFDATTGPSLTIATHALAPGRYRVEQLPAAGWTGLPAVVVELAAGGTAQARFDNVAGGTVVCERMIVAPDVLWPPRGQFVTVTVRLPQPDPTGPVRVVVDSVSQDEPLRTGRHGPLPDARRVPGHADRVGLRAYRSACGNGRVYRVHFTATGPAGDVCHGVVRVAVPRCRERPAVDNTEVKVDSFGHDCAPHRSPTAAINHLPPSRPTGGSRP